MMDLVEQIRSYKTIDWRNDKTEKGMVSSRDSGAFDNVFCTDNRPVILRCGVLR